MNKKIRFILLLIFVYSALFSQQITVGELWRNSVPNYDEYCKLDDIPLNFISRQVVKNIYAPIDFEYISPLSKKPLYNRIIKVLNSNANI